MGQRALAGVADDRAARHRLARGDDTSRRSASVAAVRGLLDEVKAGGRPSLPALVVVAREIRRLSGGME